MKFCFCVTYIVILFFTNISEASSWRCDYTYIREANGYFKYHYIPATWQDARQTCQDEGAILASPYPEKLREPLLALMRERSLSKPIFTGIHATFAKRSFHTVTGIPLSQIPMKWMCDEPDNNKNNEDCIVLNSNGLAADKNCDEPHTFFCYKEKKEDNISLLQNPCGNNDDAYIYSNITHSCYKIHTKSRSWDRAFMACANEGGHLAIINSARESEVIKTIFANYPERIISGKYMKEIAWIGTHDKYVEGDWRTIEGETVTEAGFDNFSPGEPNNYGTNGEQCGCVCRSGLLCDYGCYADIAFICEKKPNHLVCLDGNVF